VQVFCCLWLHIWLDWNVNTDLISMLISQKKIGYSLWVLWKFPVINVYGIEKVFAHPLASKKNCNLMIKPWKKPPNWYIKVNIDGSYSSGLIENQLKLR